MIVAVGVYGLGSKLTSAFESTWPSSGAGGSPMAAYSTLLWTWTWTCWAARQVAVPGESEDWTDLSWLEFATGHPMPSYPRGWAFLPFSPPWPRGQ